MPEVVHVPISKLRQDLKRAKARFNVTPTFDTAVLVQHAQRAFEHFFKEERKAWVLLITDRVLPVRSDYVAPTHFRVINGGKK